MIKLQQILSGVTVEPLLFFTIMPDMIIKMVTQNLYMEKACRVSLQMNSTICDAMSRRDHSGYTNSEEIEVQKLTSGIMAIASALHSFFPVILALFIGSWSDRHNKRKPVILAPPIGLLLTMLLLILNVIYFYELPIISTVLSDALIFPICGGLPCLFIGVYSFIGSIARDENMTVRTGIVSTAHSTAMVIGLGSSGFFYSYFGFINTFILCAVLNSAAIISGYFLIKDVPSKENEVQPMTSTKSLIYDFFSFEYIAKTFKVCFGRSPNNRRYKIICLLVLGIITGGPAAGEFAVSYLYARYRYGWSIMQFSSFNFFHLISGSIASLISIVIFSKWLKWEDATLGIIGIISSLLSIIVCALAKTGEVFFLGGVLDCFMVGGHIALRSMVVKAVPPHEIGQMSSLFGIFQAAAHFIFIPLYSIIYRNTISLFPGTFYSISLGIKIIGLFLFTLLYIDKRKTTKIKEHRKEKETITEYTKNERNFKTNV